MGTLYVALWITLSGAVIMYNKWILVYYGFPFPITLTMWHMAFSAVLATIAVKAGWVRAEKSMTPRIYWRSVVPVAVLFAGERLKLGFGMKHRRPVGGLAHVSGVRAARVLGLLRNAYHICN